MSFQIPPIVTLALRLLKEIEEAVRRFPRYHKYAHGKTLRDQAMEAAVLTHKVWRNKDRRDEFMEALIEKIDDLKLSIQLGKEIKAFRSFGEFEQIWRTIVELGKQCGGWHKQLHPDRQNVSPPSAAEQRPEKLSTQVTPTQPGLFL